MATLSITQVAELGVDARLNRMPAIDITTIQDVSEVTFTATPGLSGIFQDKTAALLLTSDADCRVAFGQSPTATATDTRLVADVAHVFAVKVGSSFRLSVRT